MSVSIEHRGEGDEAHFLVTSTRPVRYRVCRTFNEAARWKLHFEGGPLPVTIRCARCGSHGRFVKARAKRLGVADFCCARETARLERSASE